MKLISFFLSFLLLTSAVSAQSLKERTQKEYSEKKSELQEISFPKNTAANKSKGLAMLLSIVLPGAGHLYIDRMDAGKYFVGIEALSWIGLAGTNIYSGSIRDDARAFANTHAGITSSISDDDFYTNVGSYTNVYDYNNEMLATGRYENVYDINSVFWNWDNTINRDHYDARREKSERVKNASIIFATGLVINRVASAISALLLTNKSGEKTGSINSELLRDRNNNIDGLKLNFSTGF